ncbi:DUF4386 domain-containing protein [Ponticoccus sp. SC2-23]|nr:DUF4386 domain-containing protein [Ponticoccus sp. SC6-9]MBM1223094.1 DUF4386 domain-containing protein [Ponticoccus sp. SC6-15]MBM1229647.1 DUF4386 domain-containing protein [Ponticoccus sp. SC6-38]MBM1232060.1 DUF4386 domain-containing protein [Ponticoccus sp. SC6-45]MBM1237990.1 DUF4386 domain-containing protein [Ponticoccus sp. SC6-49]MBM1241071.1 DUF4386 domain-containing protein [Ponticoccus sp. SC2-64]MBM1245584.1 DUF4386 domain-containing protein [Ponticoccus sp. SC6-42]MBM1250062
MHTFQDPTSRAYARMTGLLYLIIAVAGGFAILYVPGALNVPGDPAATFANIASQRGLFHAGLLGDVVIMGAEVLVSVMLYFMFRSVSPTLSLAASYARLMMVAIMASMLFFHAASLALADGTVPLDSFSTDQRLELAGLMRHVHDAGVWIWQLFFTLHLMLLGTLVLRSGQYPALLGAALILGSVGYTLDTVQAFAFPEAALLETVKIAFLAVVSLAEITFALWLLIRGPRETTPQPAFV